MQKQPLRGVLQNRCSTTMIKTLEKCLRKDTFFSKVEGFRPATLLRMNSFSGIVEHLFLLNTFSWLLLFITLSKQKVNPAIHSHDNFNNTYGKNVHVIKNKDRSLLQNWVSGSSIARLKFSYDLNQTLFYSLSDATFFE